MKLKFVPVISPFMAVIMALGLSAPVSAASSPANYKVFYSVQVPQYDTPTSCAVNYIIPLRFGNNSWGLTHIVNNHAQLWTNNFLIGKTGAEYEIGSVVSDILQYGKLQFSGYVGGTSRNNWENQYVGWFTSGIAPGSEWCKVEVIVNMQSGNKGVITTYPIEGGVWQNNHSQFPNWLGLFGTYSHA
jgi:hypothetical protein